MEVTQKLRVNHITQSPRRYYDERGKITKNLDQAKSIFFQGKKYSLSDKSNVPKWNQEECYNLLELVYLLEEEETPKDQYEENCKKLNIPVIHPNDRNNILFYFNGLSDEYITPSEGKETVKSKDGVNNNLPEIEWEVDTEEIPMEDLFAFEDIDKKELEQIKAKEEKYKLKRIEPIVEMCIEYAVVKKGRFEDNDTIIEIPEGFDQMIENELILENHIKEASYIEKNGPPIIIVPMNISAHITKYNIKSFLEGDGYYDTQKLLDRGYIKPDKLVINSKEIYNREGTKLFTPNDELPTEFEVLDNVSHLTLEQWDRVVAIFTVGKDWQFKTYKWNNPQQTFENVKGFYIFNSSRKDHDPTLALNYPVKFYDIALLTPENYKTFLVEFWKSIEDHIFHNMPYYVNKFNYWDD